MSASVASGDVGTKRIRGRQESKALLLFELESRNLKGGIESTCFAACFQTYRYGKLLLAREGKKIYIAEPHVVETSSICKSYASESRIEPISDFFLTLSDRSHLP